MHRTTRHVLGDRIALSVLWLIFPGPPAGRKHHLRSARRRGISHGYDRRVDGASCQSDRPADAVRAVVVGLFDLSGAIFHSAALLALYAYLHRNSPIFLRRYKLHSTEKEGSFDRFQTDACSRCGICIDPCQLQSELGIDDVQSVYFLRDRRYNHCVSRWRTTA